MNALNRFLDSMACSRPEVGGGPFYRTCGVAGYVLAVIVLLGGGLLTGQPLTVLALVAGVCALSFFVYTYLRLWVTGRERLILLEHVWFALACTALTLWALGEPILPVMDTVSVALCAFLAAGRVGCLVMGCCYGRPAALGIRYDRRCAGEGFPEPLVGIRLLPVQGIEAVGLALIGLTGLMALPFAQAGRVFAWFLLAYGVMRFGLEGLRGDPRPHLLGLSQARWMCLAQAALALELTRPQALHQPVVEALLLSAFVGTLVVFRVRDPRRRLLSNAHIQEMRELTREHIQAVLEGTPEQPILRTSSRGVSLAVTMACPPNPQWAHVSLSLPDGRGDLALLCDLAARVTPAAVHRATRFTGGRVLHLLVPVPPAPEVTPEGLSLALYGSAVRHLQKEREQGEAPTGGPPPSASERLWYFTPRAGRNEKG